MRMSYQYTKYVFVAMLFLAASISIGSAHAAISLNLNVSRLFFSGCSALSPQDLQNAYSFSSLYSQGINGSGESIAIVDAYGDPSLIQDLNTFDSQYSLPAMQNGSNLVVLYPFGKPSGSSANWTQETGLDVEVAHSLAPGAKIYLVIAPNISALFSAINYTINNVPVQTISISWGASELDYQAAYLSQLNSVLEEASLRKIAIFAASGDSGSYNGLSSPNVNFPASSPDVIGVGGTVLSVSPSGSYLGETGWSSSGGGDSVVFPKPSAQPNLSTSRMVPDVAFNAGTPICAYVGSAWGGYYGTSVAAPAIAAFDAVLNQKVGGNAGFSLGTIYNAYYKEGSAVFNTMSSDVCNGLYCANGSYNRVSGVGSPKAFQLVQYISQSKESFTFFSSEPIRININGVNYTTPVSLNFTYGQNVTVHAFTTNASAGTVAAFASYSGYVNSTSQTITFPAYSNGNIDINVLLQIKVRLIDFNGDANRTVMVDNGSMFQISAPRFTNSSSVVYTLVGFRIGKGPLTVLDSESVPVEVPINVTFIWRSSTPVKLLLKYAPVGADVNASFTSYTPLSNGTSELHIQVQNRSVIAVVPGTQIDLSSTPYYAGNYRYVASNFSVLPEPSITVSFIEETRYLLDFTSTTNGIVSPSGVTISSKNQTSLFSSSTVWVPVNSTFVVDQVSYGVFSLVSSPIVLSSVGSNHTSIQLNVSDVTVHTSVYLGIPIVNAEVTLSQGGKSTTNFTSLTGSTTFENVPSGPYNLTISAYGSAYAYNGVSGVSDNIEIAPFEYIGYIITAMASIIILFAVVFGIVHRRHRLAMRYLAYH